MFQCNNCNEVFESEKTFCSTCGVEMFKKEIKNTTLDTIIAFYVTIVVYIGISYFVYKKHNNNLEIDILVESLFICIVIGFSFFDFKNIFPLYRFPKINKWRFIFYAILTIINAFIVYYITELINRLIVSNHENYYENYLYLENPLFWSFIFIALLPPIFEELAFRGFLFNLLSKVSSKKLTIITTSFLFALIHFSFISFIWIFPFGIFLGYLRSKHNSLWIPMIVHFIHNFIVLMIDYLIFDA